MGSWTALLWASYKGKNHVAPSFLNFKPIFPQKLIRLFTFIISGHTQVVELLVERGADVNAHDNYHISSIHWASGRGHANIVKILLQNSAKVNKGDKVSKF